MFTSDVIRALWANGLLYHAYARDNPKQLSTLLVSFRSHRNEQRNLRISWDLQRRNKIGFTLNSAASRQVVERILLCLVPLYPPLGKTQRWLRGKNHLLSTLHSPVC